MTSALYRAPQAVNSGARMTSLSHNEIARAALTAFLGVSNGRHTTATTRLGGGAVGPRVLLLEPHHKRDDVAAPRAGPRAPRRSPAACCYTAERFGNSSRDRGRHAGDGPSAR